MVVPTLLALGAVGGSFIAISLINTSSMLADVVEDFAVKTGRQQAGVFFAASSFMQQCSAALGVMAVGYVLSASNFPAKVVPSAVTREMELSLLSHYVPTIFLLWMVGCLFLYFYDIDQDATAKMLPDCALWKQKIAPERTKIARDHLHPFNLYVRLR